MLDRGDYNSSPSCSPRRLLDRLRAYRAAAAGSLRRRRGRRARRPAGRERGSFSAATRSRFRTGPSITPDAVLGPPRRPQARARWTESGRPVLEDRRSAQTCSSTRRRSSTTRGRGRGDAGTRRRAGGGAGARGGRVKRLLALTHRRIGTSAPRSPARRARSSRRPSRQRDFDIIEVRYGERGGPMLVKGGALGRRVGGDRDEGCRCPSAEEEVVMTRMVQLSVAGDVGEAEELEAILAHRASRSELARAVEHHPRATDAVRRCSPGQLDAAQDAIEATEPDERLPTPAPAHPTCCSGIGAVSARSASRRGTNSPIGWSREGEHQGAPRGKGSRVRGCL